MIDWSLVKPARWLPMGDEGLIMVGYRVVGVRGRMMWVAWVQHTECRAWYPVDTRFCLFCQSPVTQP